MPVESFGDPANPTLVVTGDSINAYRLLVLRHGLKMELRGMKLSRNAPPASKTIRAEFGLKRKDKKALLADYEKILRARGVLTDCDNG